MKKIVCFSFIIFLFSISYVSAENWKSVVESLIFWNGKEKNQSDQESKKKNTDNTDDDKNRLRDKYHQEKNITIKNKVRNRKKNKHKNQKK